MLDDNHRFGRSLTLLGDFDRDGVDELVVGEVGNAVWVLFLDGVSDEGVKAIDGTPCTDDSIARSSKTNIESGTTNGGRSLKL